MHPDELSDRQEIIPIHRVSQAVKRPGHEAEQQVSFTAELKNFRGKRPVPFASSRGGV
jgi:hypothetical protein